MQACSLDLDHKTFISYTANTLCYQTWSSKCMGELGNAWQDCWALLEISNHLLQSFHTT